MPNIELIMLALLHASFISFMVILVTCVIFICLLLAFCIALLLLLSLDLHYIFSLISTYLVLVESHMELAFLLCLFLFMRFVVDASKTFLEGLISIKLKVQMLMLNKEARVKM